MNALLNRLDQALNAIRPEFYQKLQPGLSANSIVALEQQLELDLPGMFKEFLAWRNGQRLDDYEGFVNNFSLMNAEQIANDWNTLTALLDTGTFHRKNWWNRNWIPFLHNGGGDHYVIDLEGTFTGNSGQILLFLHDDVSRRIEFSHFEKFLETVTFSTENGYANHEEYSDGVILSDEYIYEEIYISLNTGYPKEYNAQ